MRDQGTCPLGGSCPYDHDKKVVAQAKKEKAQKQAGQYVPPPKVNAVGPKAKPKSKAAAKKTGKGQQSQQSPTKSRDLCMRFLAGNCSKSGKDCKYVHGARAVNSLLSAINAGSQKGIIQLTPTQPGAPHAASVISCLLYTSDAADE